MEFSQIIKKNSHSFALFVMSFFHIYLIFYYVFYQKSTILTAKIARKLDFSLSKVFTPSNWNLTFQFTIF